MIDESSYTLNHKISNESSTLTVTFWLLHQSIRSNLQFGQAVPLTCQALHSPCTSSQSTFVPHSQSKYVQLSLRVESLLTLTTSNTKPSLLHLLTLTHLQAMGYLQQPPGLLPITNSSRLPPDHPTIPLRRTNMRLPSSWVTTPGQSPFDADDSDYYKSNRRPTKPPPSYPFSILTLHTALRSKSAPQCCYQHYIASSSISMTSYTIDWPCGCYKPTLLQLDTLSSL